MRRERIERSFEMCRPALERLAARLCRSAADRDDLLQATLQRALETAATQEEWEITCGWMTTVMEHLFIDSLRKAYHRLPHHNVDNLQIPAPLPEPDPLWKRVTERHLKAALAELPEKFRVPFEMFEQQRLDQREIARRLEIKLDTVASRVRRARQRLKELLTKQIKDDDERR